jgi:hypothetical protein
MARYQIWNKIDPIYALAPNKNGKAVWTAEEYINEVAPWAANPNAKAIIATGIINGAVFMELTSTVDFYKKLGVAIVDGMTDEEILAAIEDFEDNPPQADPSAEERIAAAMEFQNLMSL